MIDQSVRFNLYVSRPHLERMEAIAKAKGVSVAHLVRIAMAEYVRAYDKAQKRTAAKEE